MSDEQDGVMEWSEYGVPVGIRHAPPEPAAEPMHAEPRPGIEKVRDILFGSQTKSNEARFGRLEDSLARETYELKEMIRRRFESLESFFKSESEALAARLRAEREERLSAFEAHDRELKEVVSGLWRRLGDLDMAMNEGQSALRRELMSESRKLLEEIGLRQESMRSLLETRVNELRARKADRALVSDLMREMATQLEKDDLPAAE